MRLLVIDDDKDLANALKDGLERQCYAVDVAYDGIEGRKLAGLNDYDCVITDYNMPGMDGKELCQALRQSGKTMPIIMLTVRGETEDTVSALDAGIDDYVTKPFSFEVIAARVRALLRRPAQVLPQTLKAADVVLDLSTQSVTRGGKPLTLTRKEFMLLEYLMRHAGRVVPRPMIMEHVWDNEADPFSNTIETHILNLRKKLSPQGERRLIQTFPGRGYMFGET